MKKTLIAVGVVLGIVVVLVGASIFLTNETIEVTSTGKHDFEIATPMARVRKILVRTNATKKLVAMADAELVKQDWSDLDLEIERPLRGRDWDVSGSGTLVVKTADLMLGSHELTLKQDLLIEPEKLDVTNQLKSPSGPILDYRSTLNITPSPNGNTSVSTTLTLTIKQDVNWLTKTFAENQIRSAADRSLKKQELALREIVAGQADKLLILPEDK